MRFEEVTYCRLHHGLVRYETGFVMSQHVMLRIRVEESAMNIFPVVFSVRKLCSDLTRSTTTAGCIYKFTTYLFYW